MGRSPTRILPSPEVQLIDAEGVNQGAIKTRDALAQAQELGLDLVIIAGNSTPPVAKMLDLGRFKYAAQKKAAEARKKQKVIEVKEIQLRPNIDTHDYETKMKAVTRFLEDGDRVKVTMRFRGREMAHQDIGMGLVGEESSRRWSPRQRWNPRRAPKAVRW